MASDLSGIVESSFPTAALVSIYSMMAIYEIVIILMVGAEGGDGRVELFAEIPRIRWPRCDNRHFRFWCRSPCNGS